MKRILMLLFFLSFLNNLYIHLLMWSGLGELFY